MQPQVPFFDLRISDPTWRMELSAAFEQVLAHGRLVLGPEVGSFETRLAAFCQKRFSVGMGSGTDALYLALRALDIGPGDEVITTPMTWVGTINPIVLCGATPIFVDVRPDMNIDETLIAAALTPRTKVILPVHWHGKLCMITEICHLASKHNLYVVEDAAQAIGAERDGRRAGSFGHANCVSMNPMKLLGALGEAGAVITDDENLDNKLRSLRYAGTRNREDCHYPSLNARIDTLQAAILLVNFGHLEAKIERHRSIARFYTESLRGIVECPEAASDHVFYTYTVLADERDRLKAYLESNGIEARIRQPLLVTQQTAYRRVAKEPMPVAERLVKHILSLPIHQNLSQAQLSFVVTTVKKFYGA